MNLLATAPILLCYDRSAGAARAIETAGALFPGRRAIVLHVWSPISLMAAVYGDLVADDDRELKRAAVRLSAAGVDAAAAAGLEAKPEVIAATYGDSWHAILAVADRYDVALIVIAASGRSSLQARLLGSVSRSVAQHAHRPVLIVPPTTPAEAAKHANPNHMKHSGFDQRLYQTGALQPPSRDPAPAAWPLGSHRDTFGLTSA